MYVYYKYEKKMNLVHPNLRKGRKSVFIVSLLNCSRGMPYEHIHRSWHRSFEVLQPDWKRLPGFCCRPWQPFNSAPSSETFSKIAMPPLCTRRIK